MEVLIRSLTRSVAVCGLLVMSQALEARHAAAAEAQPGAQPTTATELNNLGVAEAQAGRHDAGATLLRQAVQLEPGNAGFRQNLSGVLTDWARHLERQGHIDEAVTVLQEAVQHDAENGSAFITLGDLLYLRRGDVPGALRAWRQAHGAVPPPVWQGVAHRIAQAQRDQLIERGFAARASPHFEIRFQESSGDDIEPLARLLEAAYAHQSAQLGKGPPRLTVLVYTARDIHRVYNQRDWALGLYDGRIRLQVDELTQPWLTDMIAHEMAHAFLHHLYPGGLPMWVHEGYAQLHERNRPRTAELDRLERGVVTRTHWVPLKWLDRRFEQPSNAEDVTRAYLQARVAVERLVRRHGMDRFKGFLQRLSSGLATEAAFEQAFAPARWAQADQGHFE